MRYNFRDASFAVVDPYQHSGRLTAGMLSAFGAPDPYILNQTRDAEILLASGTVDAAIITLSGKTESFLALIRAVRERALGAARFIPIIAMTGYSERRDIDKARDAGASFVVRRPLAPDVLFERLIWVANTSRSFVESSTYCGPDRRFRDLGLPTTGERRRRPPIRHMIVEI
jgi:DNA-binding response OmpR family regulator